MRERSVIHDTFTLIRSLPAAPEQVFAAFASEDAKSTWGDTGDLATPAGAEPPTFEFRVGDHERFSVRVAGTTYRYDARYYDIVPGARIVYAYEMLRDDERISVSLATLEFAHGPEGTVLRWTEQGAYLDGIEGVESPARRQEGTALKLEVLVRYVSEHAGTGRGRPSSAGEPQ